MERRHPPRGPSYTITPVCKANDGVRTGRCRRGPFGHRASSDYGTSRGMLQQSPMAGLRGTTVANEKILIFEAPWSEHIDQTQATRDIYTSAETLLRVGPHPVRVIQRPLIKSRYIEDIRQFTELECNQRGPNFVVFSAHGAYKQVVARRARGRKGLFHLRSLKAFDGRLNLSAGIRTASESLSRTIIVLDSCYIGKKIQSFHKASGAAGVIGFSKDVDWVDSTMFILAVLLRYHSEEVMSLKRIRKTTKKSTSRPQKVLDEMKNGAWKSLAESLGVEYYFGP